MIRDQNTVEEHAAKVHSFFAVPQRYLHKRFGVRLRQEMVAEWAAGLEFRHILDLGCGDGSISLPLLPRAESLTLVDLSAPMLDLAMAAVPPELSVRVRRLHGGFEAAAGLPVQHDLVLAIGLLAHLPDANALLQTIAAVMPPDGKLILQFSEASHPFTWLSLKLNRKGYNRTPVRWSDLRRQLEQHGFAVERVRRFGLQFPGSGRLPESWLYRFEKAVAQIPAVAWFGTDRLVLARRVSGSVHS